MGGVPGMLSGVGSAIGTGLGTAGKAFWGATKDTVNQNYIRPVRNAISDIKGNPPGAQPSPTAGVDPAGGMQPPGTGLQSAMERFMNAPQTETPAMRLRRMQQEQA